MKMHSTETFDVDVITTAASTFLCGMFNLESSQNHLQNALTRVCQKSWNPSKPQSGSGSRTMVFDYGNLDSRFLKICNSLGIKDDVKCSRRLFPHDFSLHMDPSSCNVVFNWGYLARDTSEITLFPGSGLHTYKAIIRNRLGTSPKVVVKVLSNELVETEGNMPSTEQPLVVGSDARYHSSPVPLLDGQAEVSNSSRGSSPALSDSSDFNSSNKNSQFYPVQNTQFTGQSNFDKVTASTQSFISSLAYSSAPVQYSPPRSAIYQLNLASVDYSQNFNTYRQCGSEFSCNKYSKPASILMDDVNVIA